MKSFKIIAPMTLALGAMFMLPSCNGNSKNAKVETKDSIPNIMVETVTEQEVPQLISYTATVDPYKRNNISTSTPNRIKKILVDVGSHVAAGQKVVILDAVNEDQQKLTINNLQLEYNRAVELLKIGGGTQQSVDQLHTQLASAKRAYTNLMENTVLVSPISGVVTARNYDPGDMTGATPILTIEQIQPVKVLVNISESQFAKVYEGMPCVVKLDVYGDEEFSGKISLIHPTIDTNTRTFTVEIQIQNAKNRIRPGMFARVAIDYGTVSHVVVSDRAVIKMTGTGDRYVYTFENGVVKFNKVVLGQRLENKYELISGVPNNSVVIVAGHSKLSNGCKAEVVKDAKDAK